MKKRPSKKEMLTIIGGWADRVRWILEGKFPDPPEHEQSLVAEKIEAAIRGDDEALAWLKRRYPPSINRTLQ